MKLEPIKKKQIKAAPQRSTNRAGALKKSSRFTRKRAKTHRHSRLYFIIKALMSNRRFLSLSFCFLLLLGLFFPIKQGHHYQLLVWGQETIDQLSHRLGFSTQELLVEGRQFTPVSLLNAPFKKFIGHPLYLVDIAEIQKKIERIGWVESADVRRLWPDKILLALKERVPIAILNRDKEQWYVDIKGEKIAQIKDDQNTLPPSYPLINISGHHAEHKVADLLEDLTSHPGLKDRIALAEWLNQRRWRFYFEDGAAADMPADDLSKAWRQLAELERDYAVLKNPEQIIDLRIKGRLFIRKSQNKNNLSVKTRAVQ